jgi:hypothetical protein
MNRKFAALIIFLALFTRVERFCHHQTEGFQLYKIIPSPKQLVQAPCETNTPEIDKLLTQPFHFFGSGGQAYAFLGADNETVIKVFKYHHLDTPKQIEELILSLSIANQELKHETALLYLHLAPSTAILPNQLTLIDKLKISHVVDPNQLTFVLQKKAEPICSAIDRMMLFQDTQCVKACIDSLLSLVVSRCEKGIVDKDFRIKRNCGLIGNQAMVIDVGLFARQETLKDSEHAKRRIKKELENFRTWIRDNHPEFQEYLQYRIDHALD